MASLEQLQMLEEEETTTSSSSNSNSSSNKSNINSTNNSDNEDDIENRDVVDEEPTSNSASTGHPKKRLKLSLGGTVNVILSKPQNNVPEENNNSIDADNDFEKPTPATAAANPRSDINSKNPVSSSFNSGKLSSEKEALNSKSSSSNNNVTTQDINDGLNDSETSSIIKIKLKSSNPVKSSSESIQQKSQQQNKESLCSTVAATKAIVQNKKRKSIPIRLPPMSSPGLLLAGNHLRGAGNTNIKANEFISPNAVFKTSMETAGYSVGNRTNSPHRGSSVELVVDDLFDLDVKSNRRFPELVPKELLLGSGPNSETNQLKVGPSLPERLMKAFEIKNSRFSSTSTSEKHDDTWIPSYSNMIPLSLTFPYTDIYIKKRLEYIRDINIREKAIVKLQKEQEDLELNQDSKTSITINVKDIPPIPVQPDPPTLNDLKDIPLRKDIFGSEEQHQKDHPLYMPQNRILVNHLDNRCFHIVDGRYFGLSTNSIADPHFFGPSAGYGNLSSSSGLATATAGGSLLIAPTQPSSTISFNKTANESTTVTTAQTNQLE